MRKKNVNTSLVIVLLVLVGLLGYNMLVQAGSLEPSAAPAPTMKTLQEVYEIHDFTEPDVQIFYMKLLWVYLKGFRFHIVGIDIRTGDLIMRNQRLSR